MCDNSITWYRIRSLIDESEKSREEIAKSAELDCDTSTITKHYNGDRKISAEYIVKYAKYFNVSADYLLGISDVKTTDKDLEYICAYTGLAEEVIEKLHNMAGKGTHIENVILILNNLLKDKILNDILQLLSRLLYQYDTHYSLCGNISNFDLKKADYVGVCEFISNCESELSSEDEIDLLRFRISKEFEKLIDNEIKQRVYMSNWKNVIEKMQQKKEDYLQKCFAIYAEEYSSGKKGYKHMKIRDVVRNNDEDLPF